MTNVLQDGPNVAKLELLLVRRITEYLLKRIISGCTELEGWRTYATSLKLVRNKKYDLLGHPNLEKMLVIF